MGSIVFHMGSIAVYLRKRFTSMVSEFQAYGYFAFTSVRRIDALLYCSSKNTK